MDIYELGEAIPVSLNVKSVDKKLKFSLFPHDSKAVINTSIVITAFFLLLSMLVASLSSFISYLLLFAGVLLGIILYIYPTSVFYSHRLGEYNEEMLRAILRLSTFVSMDTSLEYAFFETAEHLHGTLKLQFLDIKDSLERKTVMTLGDAMYKYVDVWNEVNPVFVKSLRLLQTAALSNPEDRESILKETTDTLLLNFTTLGKRFSEKLTNNAKKLVSLGVLLPIMSLMLLPLVSVFLPKMVQPSMLAFVYVILFPTITLLMALNFSSKRIQVDTIRIQEAQSYKPMSKNFLILVLGLVVIFAIPTLLYVQSILKGTAGDTETLFALTMGWLISAGIAIAAYFYSIIYTKKYKTLWSEINEVEQDLPHLLQSFSTYLSLNISTENVIPEVINDYESFGFKKHPVVKAFKKLNRLLLTSKQEIEVIVDKYLIKLLPSRKVVQVISQIISFGKISQKSSMKVSKMIREQTIGLYKLDDYIKTLLAESVGLINVTSSMLAPLLCAAAVIMSVAIVKSLLFITKQLELIASAFGSDFTLNIVNTKAIINPIFIEVVVGLYLIETIIILSYFSTSIQVGNDLFKFLDSLRSNLIGFIIYSAILFGGYLFTVKVLFGSVLGLG